VSAVATAALADVANRRSEIVELATRSGELVSLGALLVLLNLSHAAASRGLHLALDCLDT
jgi:hypothetical protein